MTASSPAASAPRRAPHLRWLTQEQSELARQFLALPGAASFLTLVSAACLLAGLYGVIAPTIGDGDDPSARFAALGAIALYLGSLLAVIGTMCRWQPGNPDALGASVVGAALVVGQAVTLDLIAVDQPRLTALLAALGLGAVAWLVRTWNHLTQGQAVAGLRLPLALLLMWNYQWPVAFGLRQALEIRHPGMAALHPVFLWLVGMAVVLVAALLGLRACHHDAAALAAQARGPLLGSRTLRWVMLLVLLGATTAHQYVIAYGASLDLLDSDLAPLVAVLVMIANEVRAGCAGGNRVRDALTLGVPALLLVLLSVSGASLATDVMNRGPDAAQPWLRGLHPLATLALVSGLGLAGWWRTRRAGLLLGVAASSIACALLVDASPGAVDAHAGLGVATLWCLGYALWRRHVLLGLAGLVLSEVLVLSASGVRPWIAMLGLNEIAAALAVTGMTTLVVAVLRPAWLGAAAARWAAWLMTAGCYGCCLPDTSALHAPRGGTIVLLAALAVAAWRRRDRWLLGPLLVPALGILPELIPRRAAWLAVDAAFVLLAGALGTGRHRLRCLERPPAPDAHRLIADPPRAGSA